MSKTKLRYHAEVKTFTRAPTLLDLCMVAVDYTINGFGRMCGRLRRCSEFVDLSN